MEFLSSFITGLSLGSIYALIALGYTMVYGIAKMLNFAHGDIIMVGAFTVIVASNMAMPPAVSILFAILVCVGLGIIIEKIAYKPLRNASPLAVLITAIGVGYFFTKPGAACFWNRADAISQYLESCANPYNREPGHTGRFRCDACGDVCADGCPFFIYKQNKSRQGDGSGSGRQGCRPADGHKCG